MGIRERMSLIEQCEKLCGAYGGPCSKCPALELSEKHGSFCTFNEMSEVDLDAYIQAFRQAGITGTREGDVQKPVADELHKDNVNDPIHPSHYKLPGGMQVIDVEVAMFGKEWVQHHCICTSVEYLLRHLQKNGSEDVRKAHWWLSQWMELEAKSE